MYLEFFKLDDYPFRLTADPRYLYLSEAHARAKAYLKYVLHISDSFAVITGEVGTGKTTIVNDVLQHLEEDIVVAKVHQTRLTDTQFLQALLLQFGVEPFKARKVKLLDLLDHYLAEQRAAGRKVILVIDEAQHLRPGVLEEMRMLADIEIENRKVLNVILVGQPELNALLDAPGREQIAQRIRLRHHINGLSERETQEYIDHRLWVAGKETTAHFPLDTVPLIHGYTGGIPRLINVLCDLTLIGAFIRNERFVTRETVQVALDKLKWVPYDERSTIRSRKSGQRNHAPQLHAAKLIVSRGGQPIGEYPLDKQSMIIGRNTIHDIALEGKRVSRSHARVAQFSTGFYLHDLRSTNGTFVNGQPVKLHQLQHGDVVGIGDYELRFVEDTPVTTGDPAASDEPGEPVSIFSIIRTG